MCTSSRRRRFDEEVEEVAEQLRHAADAVIEQRAAVEVPAEDDDRALGAQRGLRERLEVRLAVDDERYAGRHGRRAWQFRPGTNRLARAGGRLACSAGARRESPVCGRGADIYGSGRARRHGRASARPVPETCRSPPRSAPLVKRPGLRSSAGSRLGAARSCRRRLSGGGGIGQSSFSVERCASAKRPRDVLPVPHVPDRVEVLRLLVLVLQVVGVLPGIEHQQRHAAHERFRTGDRGSAR